MNVAVARRRWTESSFLTDVEHRSDGSLLLSPRVVLGGYPLRMMDSLEYWAAVAPDRVLVARRGRADEVGHNLLYADVGTRTARRRTRTGDPRAFSRSTDCDSFRETASNT